VRVGEGGGGDEEEEGDLDSIDTMKMAKVKMMMGELM
jgi:hypothetical protein